MSTKRPQRLAHQSESKCSELPTPSPLNFELAHKEEVVNGDST
jgi:hypothetical protein